MFFCINHKQQEDILQGTTISHTYLKSFLAWTMLLGKENLDPIFKTSLFSSSPQLSANFQRSFSPEIIQTISSTFGYIPSTDEKMKQRLQIPSTTLLPPPKKTKTKIIKALKPFLGRGHLIPNESLFRCQVSRVHPHDFHYRQPEKPCFQRAPVG